MAEQEIIIEKEESKKPDWIKLKPNEIEKTIVDLANEGNSPAKIGLILRDKYGIPKVKSILNKKIEEILKAKNIKYPTETEGSEKKIKTLHSHIEANKHDYSAQKSLEKSLWHLKRLQNQKVFASTSD